MSFLNGEAASLPQGDVRLLDTPTAQRLLTTPLDFHERFAGRTPEPVLAAFGADR